jgi:hypothetical protein
MSEKIVWGLTKNHSADRVEVYKCEGGTPIAPGKLAILNANGNIEVGTSTGNIIGVVIGADGMTNNNMLVGYQDVAVTAAEVRVMCSDNFTCGAPAYAGANGVVAAAGTVKVGIFAEPKVAGAIWAKIKRV